MSVIDIIKFKIKEVLNKTIPYTHWGLTAPTPTPQTPTSSKFSACILITELGNTN